MRGRRKCPTTEKTENTEEKRCRQEVIARMPSVIFLSEHTALFEGYEAVVAEVDVVEELDAEERTALVEAMSDSADFGAG